MPFAEWKFITIRAFKAYGNDNCSSFAAATAYYALLSIFPIVVFAISFGGYFIHADAETRIINFLMDNLPLGQSARPQLESALSAVAGGRGGLGILGLLGVAYSASALFSSLRTGLNVVFQVKKQRPFLQGALLDLGMVFGLGILILLSLALTFVIALAQHFSDQLFGGRVTALTDLLLTVAYFVAPGAVSLLIFILIYKFVPHAELSWKDVLPGAIIAAIGVEVLKIGFAQYATHFGNYDATYGTLGFVIAFLALASFAAQVALFGAEFTRSYTEVASGAVPAVSPAVPKKPESLAQRVEDMVKGLFVNEEPHHDERLPYKPADDRGTLTDQQAANRAGQAAHEVESTAPPAGRR